MPAAVSSRHGTPCPCRARSGPGSRRSARTRPWRTPHRTRPSAGRLRGAQPGARPHRLHPVRVHLEVDVGPATVVGRGEGAREGHVPVGVGLLHAAQVVLAGGARRVHGVAALLVAVPDVHRGAGRGTQPFAVLSTRRTAIVIGTPAATPLALPKLRTMSRRTTPLWFSTFFPVRPVPGERTGRLLGDDRARAVGRRGQ